MACSLNPVFKRTDITIQRLERRLSVISWQVRRRHIPDDHPSPWIHVRSTGLYLEKENIDYPFRGATKIFVLNGRYPSVEFEILAGLDPGRIQLVVAVLILAEGRRVTLLRSGLLLFSMTNSLAAFV